MYKTASKGKKRHPPYLVKKSWHPLLTRPPPPPPNEYMFGFLDERTKEGQKATHNLNKT